MTGGRVRRFVAGIHLPTVSLWLAALVLVFAFAGVAARDDPVPGFHEQACSLPRPWLARAQRGHLDGRSGQIALLPRYPAYLGTAEGGWSHSGPWGYLQHIPLVFYGPGVVGSAQVVERPATLADVAPTMMRLLRGSFQTDDGSPLQEVAVVGPKLLRADPPRLILVIVWDGGGWNVLERWPDSWPNLKRLMAEGISYSNATVGSSPSVTPSVHTTLGTGVFPWAHGITGIPVRDTDGTVADSFLEGESGRFMNSVALAERWDVHTNNRARIGMVGYEPWHLGMIGRGAEDPSGDKDDAVWLDRETSEWITNPDHYTLPSIFRDTSVLQEELRDLDAADGAIDEAWGKHDILEDRDRIEETPAFVAYHGRTLRDLIATGYGRDRVTDLLFTNFKQIDRLGHYFNMASDEVRQALEETDRQLGETIDFLDREVGRGRWAVVVTADHGQQPDANVVEGYGIDPKEVERDLDEEFGAITRKVWPTEVFFHPDVTVNSAEVARFLGNYRLADNTQRPDMLLTGAGRFDPEDRLFQMAIPSRMLPDLRCGEAGH